MKIETADYLDFKDVLIKPKRSTLSSRREVDLEREFVGKHSQVKWKGIPIIAANMDTVGTFDMAIALSEFNILTAVHKFYSLEEWQKFAKKNPDVLKNIFVTVGSQEKDFQKLQAILKEIPQIDKICVDIANGYSEHFLAKLKEIRKAFPNKLLMAGNVVTYEMVEELVLNGVDIVKVGIGPGSVCTTRKMTGVGVPQLSAIIECSDAAHGLDGLICGDGGCTDSGDIARAFAGGADFVMIGGMLAGHKESNGKIFKEKVGNSVQKYMEFYGMSSTTAMNKHYKQKYDYRASEGKYVKIAYKGKVKETIEQILGGIRSTCTYVGAKKIKHLPKKTTFIRVRNTINNVFS